MISSPASSVLSLCLLTPYRQINCVPLVMLTNFAAPIKPNLAGPLLPQDCPLPVAL